jgi:hypothetical protein
MEIQITHPQAQKLRVNDQLAIGFWGPTYEFKEIFKSRGYKFQEFPVSKWFERFVKGLGTVTMKGWVKVFQTEEERAEDIEFAKTLKATQPLTWKC